MRVRSLLYERQVYLTNAKSTWRFSYSLALDGAFAPDLFQKHLRFGGLEIKRRILGMNASAESTLRVPSLPDDC